MSEMTGAPRPQMNRRPTSRRVMLTDRVAEVVITVGGFGVLAAVLGICVYLAFVVAPLFGVGSVERSGGSVIAPAVGGAQRVLGLDEYGELLASWDGGSVVSVVSAIDGSLVRDFKVAPDGVEARSLSAPSLDDRVAIGLSDGRVVLGTLAFPSRVVAEGAAPAGAREVGVGERWIGPEGAATRLDASRYRLTRAEADFGAAEAVGLEGAVTHVDYRDGSVGRRTMLARDASGDAVLRVMVERRGLGMGSARLVPLMSERFAIPDAGEGGAGGDAEAPGWVFATRDGDAVLAVWRDGRVRRYGPDGEGDWGLRESIPATRGGVGVSTAAMALGGRTLLLGTTEGVLLGWSVARDAASASGDAQRLVRSRRVEMSGASLTALRVARQDRLVLAVDAEGAMSIAHLASGKRVASGLGAEVGVRDAALGPRGDRVVAIGGAGGEALAAYAIDTAHPEVSFRTLFGPVKYEGEAEAGFVYQSSASEDAAEAKLSLAPLIFGTIKATVFAMLFATPVAVLAAIYTSEFLRPETRRIVKPAVEMMASLPSVVLGFVAAVLVAPLLRDHLAGFVIGVGLVPVAVLAAAHVWQVAPARTRRWFGGGRRMLAVGLVAAVTAGTVLWLGPRVESWLFKPTRGDALVLAGSVRAAPPERVPAWVGQRASMSADEARRLRVEGLAFVDGRVVEPVEPEGDEAERVASAASDAISGGGMRLWLDGAIGGAWPGWFLLSTPVAWLLVWVVGGRLAARGLGGATASGWVGLVRFGLGVAAGVGLGALGAWGLTALGVDPRDSLFGPFSQRNALVVGVIMGFAVIPIIYTLADDAMTSVPDGLRSASLGAGATRWQTAVRVVAPVAGSGIFSAVMIGLGRAVGETMIVLMATGNTPVMEWNMFSGLRTLAANIAVELPEAPPGSTHYRVLFLCGLTLFVLTFIINTTAEGVRQRFRKRSAML